LSNKNANQVFVPAINSGVPLRTPSGVEKDWLTSAAPNKTQRAQAVRTVMRRRRTDFPTAPLSKKDVPCPIEDQFGTTGSDVHPETTARSFRGSKDGLPERSPIPPGEGCGGIRPRKRVVVSAKDPPPLGTSSFLAGKP